MNGSLLGRGRGGRLAVYAGCVVVVVLLVFAYRAAVSEISRLRDLYDQCSSHQESLQQRFQMIFDYKVRLEKSLADETSANAAVKQELQQRANREKSRRDKDSVEAMQRYNSLQQDYKTLQTVHQDLQDECDKRQKVALDNTTRLENMVQGLKLEVKQAKDDKIQSLEHLKNKYLEMDIDKAKIEEKYNEFVKNNEELSIDNQRLQKEVFQLNRELDEAKRSCGAHPAAAPSMSSPSVLISSKLQSKNSGDVEDAQQGAGGPRPPSDQQSSSTTTSSRLVTNRSSEVSSKSLTKSTTQSLLEKIQAADRVNKVQKLPIGVLPIPKMFDSEKNAVLVNEGNNKKENKNGGSSNNAQVIIPEKDDKIVPVVNEINENILDLQRVHPAAPGRHGAGEKQQIGRQENWVWQHKVPPGVQEVGEDPNILGKIPELEETGNHPVGDGVEYGQYEGGDYDKEMPPKNSDLHIEEGEDEGEDEDDGMEYDGNNLKVEKHPE